MLCPFDPIPAAHAEFPCDCIEEFDTVIRTSSLVALTFRSCRPYLRKPCATVKGVRRVKRRKACDAPSARDRVSATLGAIAILSLATAAFMRPQPLPAGVARYAGPFGNTS